MGNRIGKKRVLISDMNASLLTGRECRLDVARLSPPALLRGSKVVECLEEIKGLLLRKTMTCMSVFPPRVSFVVSELDFSIFWRSGSTR